MQERDKIYFASDFHLGSPNIQDSMVREKKICRWLESIQAQAKEIYLVGDIFDFWFEYKHVIPKGFERFKGTLANLTDQGVKIHFFPGNHDLWTFGYLENELGLIVHKEPLITTINNKTFYITHGDGIGAGDIRYKFASFSDKSIIYTTVHIVCFRGCKLSHDSCFFTDSKRVTKSYDELFALRVINQPSQINIKF